uniref:Uncharacterized protein n=1 Tax=Anguilla anguilla TaxID=7936 RepID=A0A0E9UQ22_ANGAN
MVKVLANLALRCARHYPLRSQICD